jgi:hypothetical protein
VVRRYLPWGIPLAVILVAGIVLLTLDHSDTVLTAIGLGLLSIGSIGLVSLAFYAVGRSEDEERAAGDR